MAAPAEPPALPDPDLALAAAIAAAAVRDRLATRLPGLETALRSADDDALRAAASVARLQADVARLESPSPTRIWTTLRGSRDDDLDRARDELRSAEHEAAASAARRASAAADLEALDTEIASLGDVDAAVDAARVACVRATDPQRAASADELASRITSALATLRATDEAAVAAGAALHALDEVAASLGTATGLAAVDTFLGGGWGADLLKLDRIDTASTRMRRADERMRALNAALADLGLPRVRRVVLGHLNARFDLVFDNAVSDSSVLGRVRNAKGRVDEAREQVGAVLREVETRRIAAIEHLDALRAARARVLDGRDGPPRQP